MKKLILMALENYFNIGNIIMLSLTRKKYKNHVARNLISDELKNMNGNSIYKIYKKIFIFIFENKYYRQETIYGKKLNSNWVLYIRYLNKEKQTHNLWETLLIKTNSFIYAFPLWTDIVRLYNIFLNI